MTTITDTPTTAPRRTPVDWQAIAERLMHPTQWAVLQIFRGAEPDCTLTPTAIAGLIGEPLANTSYHVRRLVHDGILALDNESHVRGAIQHHYRLAIHTLGPHEDVVELATIVDRNLRALGWDLGEDDLVEERLKELIDRYSVGDVPGGGR